MTEGTVRNSIRARRGIVALCFWLIAGLTAYGGEGAGSPPAIIPAPVKLRLQKGHFVFGPNTVVLLETQESGARWVGDYLCTLVGNASARAVPLRVEDGTDAKGAIHLSLGAPARLGPQGYELNVSPHAIRIRAAGVAGLFYGVQTLRQMLPPEIETGAPHKGPFTVPCLAIEDAPRFAWRGLMLDCGRTFLPIGYLRLSLDRMALYKLNVLHLHLTDDQGWRLEIKKYPKLTSVGAHFAERYGGGGGFYSQQEMRDLVAYAAERNITVVPEVEMPGHSLEVLAAYPELACELALRPILEVHPFFEGPQQFSPPLCAGNERVFQMFGNILSEVADLFPSAFIHVGGDEVPKDSWNRCPRCQARIKEEGLKDAEELQSYFTRRIEKMVRAKGRRMIGWDEILQGGLAEGATVMSWRGTAGGVAAAKLGHDVVMTPNGSCYFDYTYHTTPTEKVYAYDPAPQEMSPEMAAHVLGVEASMWTHIATNEKAIDYQIYPRLAALAEVAWSPQSQRAWPDFHARLGSHLRRLELLGIHYGNEAFPGRKLGAWQASDLSGHAPRVFEWDATALVAGPGEYKVEVRREDGRGPVYVRSVALAEDGREISREVFAGPLTEANDVAVGWLECAKRNPAARYSMRVTLEGTEGGALSGSVWMEEQSRSRESSREVDSRESRVEELRTRRGSNLVP